MGLHERNRVDKMTDYISREAVLAFAKDIIVPTKDGGIYRHRCIDPCDIRDIPAADVRENKPGKWERTSYKSGYGYRCSECGAIYNKRKSRLNFCPSCGADVRGEADG